MKIDIFLGKPWYHAINVNQADHVKACLRLDEKDEVMSYGKGAPAEGAENADLSCSADMCNGDCSMTGAAKVRQRTWLKHK